MTVIGFARIGRWLDIDWECEFCDHENSSIIHDNQKTLHCPHCKKQHVLWKENTIG